MAEIDDQGDSAGRGKHLGRFALVFVHRRATWQHVGAFLKREFGDVSSFGGMGETPSTLEPMLCRHNPGGAHYWPIVNAVGPPAHAECFNQEQFTRPCVCKGTYDKGKAPGIVVSDLCRRAGRFLSEHGIGDSDEPTGRDFEYVANDDPSSQSSQNTTSSLEVPFSEVMDLRQDAPEGAPVDPLAGGGSSVDTEVERDDGGLVSEDDVEQTLDSADPQPMRGLLRHDSSMVDVEDLPESQDSVLQSDGRGGTTKMRAATLAYLWKFADQPNVLREEFRKLRTNTYLQVLHLCGCGMGEEMVDGVTTAGCTERSHLMLGSSLLNRDQRSWHEVFHLVGRRHYADAVALAHRSRTGQGLL